MDSSSFLFKLIHRPTNGSKKLKNCSASHSTIDSKPENFYPVKNIVKFGKFSRFVIYNDVKFCQFFNFQTENWQFCQQVHEFFN